MDVLGRACQLARGLGAPLTLLYVFTLPTYAYGEGTVMTLGLSRRIESAAHGALEELRTALACEGVVVDASVAQGGHPAETIARIASEGRCRMIVMATSDRTTAGHDFLGRVTDRVLRLAPCPVLTMRR